MASLTVAATGDSLITMRVAQSQAPGFHRLVELIRGQDVAFTNLEVGLHDYCGVPQAASKGIYAVGHPRLIEDLKHIGFSLYSIANNHMMDWGDGGLFATMETLDRAGVVYAGAGRHLQDARSPRYLEVAAGRVALIAVTSTFPPHAPAGEQRTDCQGRPGVNPLRFNEVFTVERSAFDHIVGAYHALGLDRRRQFLIQLGVEHPDAAGVATAFDRKFRAGAAARVDTAPHAGDLNGNLQWVRDARRQADWVIVSVHAHELLPSAGYDVPADFVPAFCRAVVDAGADLVIGHGPHRLRGVEVYRGRPILYSLGNFIYQPETLRLHPADYYEALRVPLTGTPADTVEVRGQLDPVLWESAVATCRLGDDGVEELRLYPLTLGHDLPRPRRGTPVLADEESGCGIIRRIVALSPAVGIDWHPDGFGRVRWSD
jgi:poly-gamma-glutamate capsule biosynthesis protein CapA/YwtB (metallophosphatase superfamily)